MSKIGELFGRNVVPTTLYLTQNKRTFPDPTLIMGMELEIENALHLNAPRIFTTTEDGSLRNGGVEFVSRPAFYYQLYHGLEQFFNKLNPPLQTLHEEDGSYSDRSNYSDRTSIHVHTNVVDLTKEQLATICMLYQVFERCLFEFVGADRDKNIFCVPWYETNMGKSTVKHLLQGEFAPVYDWQKYTALNLLPIQERGSIEWRHLPGTNDLGKIDTWLHIIGSIYRAAREQPFQYWMDMLLQLNSNSQYELAFRRIFEGVPAFNPAHYREQIESGVMDLKVDWY